MGILVRENAGTAQSPETAVLIKYTFQGVKMINDRDSSSLSFPTKKSSSSSETAQIRVLKEAGGAYLSGPVMLATLFNDGMHRMEVSMAIGLKSARRKRVLSACQLFTTQKRARLSTYNPAKLAETNTPKRPSGTNIKNVPCFFVAPLCELGGYMSLSFVLLTEYKSYSIL